MFRPQHTLWAVTDWPEGAAGLHHPGDVERAGRVAVVGPQQLRPQHHQDRRQHHCGGVEGDAGPAAGEGSESLEWNGQVQVV